MVNDLIGLAALFWLAAGLIALAGRGVAFGRGLAGLGCLAGMIAAILALPGASPPVALPVFRIADEGSGFTLSPAALWLLGFGLAPAMLAACLGSPGRGGRFWLFGLSMSLIGALGVFGVTQGAAFLIAWEIMSLGGAAMILGERLGEGAGGHALFMLGLLEVGAVALLAAVLVLGTASGSLDFGGFASAWRGAALYGPAIAGGLLIVGFGAKLGLLPFYEWFPGAYAAGSGATGAVLSGVVLNAAFFGLARGLLVWLPGGVDEGFGIALCAIGVTSAILTTLYAFQQEDWRALLAFSTAENASVAVIALGAALLFAAGHLPLFAGLAFTVALLHLAAHALAKGALFLAADGVFAATGGYAIRQDGMLRANTPIFGIGALFAAMSLAAMPPQAGFVSEWFMFQTVFQGFHLPGLAGRLTLVLTGAGLALTAAIAFATFVKLFGVGLQGRAADGGARLPARHQSAVAALGLAVLALAVGMPVWLGALARSWPAHVAIDAAAHMADGWILVPLSAGFAFISPSKLVIVMPLLALVPVMAILLSRRRPARRVPIWYGGSPRLDRRNATTALTFSNSLRTFYSFVYRPRAETGVETSLSPYFVKHLRFEHDVAPIFGPALFGPAVRLANGLARRARVLQSGYLNLYLGIIGLLLVAILVVALF